MSSKKNKHQHRRHHSHDAATVFKEKSLAAIERRKMFEKYLKIFLYVLAVIMAVAVVIVYKFL